MSDTTTSTTVPPATPATVAAAATPPTTPTPALASAPEGVQQVDPAEVPSTVEKLPADHPLVKTLEAQKSEMKELREKARRLQEIEDAQKSEAEKLVERAERAEKALADAQLSADRAEVAAAKGVPASLLTGANRAEFEAAADALLAFRGAQATAPPAVAQGNVGEPIAGGDDLDAQIAAAMAAGNFERAIGLKQLRAARDKTKN